MKYKFLPDLFLILSLGLCAIALWLWELYSHSGWPGLQWVRESYWSVYFILFFTVFAYLFPFRHLKERSPWDLLLPGLVLYTVSLVAFHLAKAILFTLFSPFGATMGFRLLIFLILVIFFTSYGFYLVTQQQIMKVRGRQIMLFMIIITSTVPLSLLTVKLYNGPAAGSYTSFIDAVKVGYPFFWIVIGMGLASIYSQLYLGRVPEKETSNYRPDILDDHLLM